MVYTFIEPKKQSCNSLVKGEVWTEQSELVNQDDNKNVIMNIKQTFSQALLRLEALLICLVSLRELIFKQEAETMPAEIFEGHCHVLYTPCLHLSMSVHQCTQLKAPITTLTAFWCPHISAPSTSLISEGEWVGYREWSKNEKKEEMAGSAW